MFHCANLDAVAYERAQQVLHFHHGMAQLILVMVICRLSEPYLKNEGYREQTERFYLLQGVSKKLYFYRTSFIKPPVF